VDRTFTPGIDENQRSCRLQQWNKALRCAKAWAQDT
jgi:glycerol kinase